jgi:hypothetical protein
MGGEDEHGLCLDGLRGKTRNTSVRIVCVPTQIRTERYWVVLFGIYEAESVNRSHMDTKRKTYDIRTWKKTFIPRHILHQHICTCPIALLMRRNPQHISFLTVVSATSASPFQPLRHQRNSCDAVLKSFTRQTLPTVNRKHFSANIICMEAFCPQIRAIERCSSVIYSSSTVCHFDYWNQPLNMRIRICYCHIAGLCCHLVMHIKSITSIAVVFLPFVIYLLTLPRIFNITKAFHKINCTYVAIYVLQIMNRVPLFSYVHNMY